MNKYELAAVIGNYDKTCTILDTIDSIAKSGFRNVFLEWYNEDWPISQEEQLRYAREKGLNIIFAHLGYQNINNLWIEEETGIVDRYKNDIKVCADNNIPMVVMHLTSHSVAPMYNEIGLKRIKEICDYAKSLNIKIAFENTKIKGYLEYALGNIDNDNVGVCYDSGHCHAHFNDEFEFDRFKNRIFAVHLHDNDGSADQHLLPFDGTIDWHKLAKNLKDSNYDGPLTFEIHHHRDYANMPLDEFYQKGYEIALKIKEIFENS